MRDAKKMKMKMNNLLWLVWVASVAIFSLFGFVAAGYYNYIVGSFAFLALSLSFSRKDQTRKVLILTSIVGIFFGALVNIFFWGPKGIDAIGGVIYIIASLIFSYAIAKIYMIEKQAE